MDGKELRERINEAIPTSDLDWPGDDIVAAAVARGIVAALGITRESVQAILVAADALDGKRSKRLPHDALARRQLELVNEARTTAKRVTALLDAAEAP